MSETFSVVLTGKILNDESLEDVKINVGAAFKLKAPQLDKLFSGKPVAIKRGLDKKQAVRLSTRLQQLGAHAVIKASVAKPAQEESAKPAVPFTDIVAAMPEPGEEPAPQEQPVPAPKAKPEPVSVAALEPEPEVVAEPEPEPEPEPEQASVVAEVAVEPEAVAANEDVAVPADVEAEPATASASDDNITCPRCGHEQAFTTACGYCKMDLSLHIKRMQKRAKIIANAKRA